MALNLKEALEELHSGEWLSLRCFTADVLKGTGGKVIEFVKCRILRSHPVNVPGAKESVATMAAPDGEGKDPRHNIHFTRNVELQNRQIRKVHPILIQQINNQTVL